MEHVCMFKIKDWNTNIEFEREKKIASANVVGEAQRN
jgi:hypothetical protein